MDWYTSPRWTAEIADFCSNTTPFRNTQTYNENKLDKFFVGNNMLQTAQELLLVA